MNAQSQSSNWWKLIGPWSKRETPTVDVQSSDAPRQARAREAASLVALARSTAWEHRREEFVWYALALSALVLLVLSFWL